MTDLASATQPCVETRLSPTASAYLPVMALPPRLATHVRAAPCPTAVVASLWGELQLSSGLVAREFPVWLSAEFDGVDGLRPKSLLNKLYMEREDRLQPGILLGVLV